MKAYLVEENGEQRVVEVSGFKPSNSIAMIPASFNKEDYPFIRAQEVFNEDFQINELQFYVDEVAKGQFIAEVANKELKSSLYKTYIADIENQMTIVFGTTNRDSANAKYLTWKEMASDPDTYADQGLKDTNGDVMTTFTQVLNYANAKIQMAKDYSIFLMKREIQYKEDLEQIS